MNRWPALLLILALVGGLVALDQQRSGSSDSSAGGSSIVDYRGPAAEAAGASGSTWFCPAGFVTPDGLNDHVVTITNPTADDVVGELTIYPSLLDTDGNTIAFERGVRTIAIGAGEQQRISLAPLVASLNPSLATNTGAFVGALAEFDGSGVFVEHAMLAARGADVGPCATSASDAWWFASGTTTADVDYQLYLLNPFPDNAVVDISFVTDDGTRTPSAFNGRLIPAQSLTVLQVSSEARVSAQTTAEIQVLTGRVIAERIQLFENATGPSGLSMSLGTSQLAEQWFFPAGQAFPGAGESYVISNPGDLDAEVEFELKPDSADRAGDVAPRSVPVGAGERWIVTVNSHDTHPVDALTAVGVNAMATGGQGYFVSVRSFNGVPVAVERVVTRPLAAGGASASFGHTHAATEQLVTLPNIGADVSNATLAVLNPAGDTIARVEVLVGSAAGESSRATIELAPRRRASFDLASLVEPQDEWIRIVSSTGTMAELAISVDDLLLTTPALPVRGTVSTPDLLAFD